MRIALAFVTILLLAGCANDFSKFYNGMTKDEVVSHTGPRADVEPRVIVTDNIDAQNERLAQNNYARVGESSFQSNATSRAEANAVAQAKAIGAEMIVLSSRDAGTRTAVMPLVTPTTATATSNFNGTAFNPAYGTTNVNGSATTTSYGTTTTYVPITVHRADYYAGYWVKAKPPAVGIHVMPLSPEEHRRIGTNSGLLINVVVIGSPAYRADIFKGDILMSIGDIRVDTADDVQQAIKKYLGATVEIQVLRDGQVLKKSVALATP
ncbi:PDZ domain-containing protein [Burkholderia sp. L27(2015)]|uniref:PDZ domain-containing protein n=1 Tax=Burkholderia sp. L27(2015) TaxID=1641858 RepID=UPI00131AAF7C|nr:PDZ domain-containing protein [Burkholderia sp. L27(2015)]